MKRILLAAVATAAFAAPVAAEPYVGVEAGVLIPRDRDPGSDVDRRFTGGEWVDFLDINHGLGFDADLIAGYDFGMFRLEGEIAYKRAKHDEYQIEDLAPGPFPGGGTEPVVPGAEISADGRSSVLSGMVNALLDLDVSPGTSVYAGGGIGLARVSMTIDRLGDQKLHFKDTDNLAWQVIAGVRTAISENIDAGLKYRFFSAGTLKSDFFGAPPGFDGRSSFQSHSLMASLIYNFAAAPPPPPPPPPPAPPEPAAPQPPATQTCPDGTVILATDTCPAAPPPPPPPLPAPERG